MSLARRHARGPHFARSLEWLLFTALELETNTSSLTRGHGGGRRAAAASVAGGHVPGSADKAAADRSSRPTGASEGGELRKQQVRTNHKAWWCCPQPAFCALLPAPAFPWTYPALRITPAPIAPCAPSPTPRCWSHRSLRPAPH